MPMRKWILSLLCYSGAVVVAADEPVILTHPSTMPHLIDEVNLRSSDNLNVVVEIPSGSVQKWEVDYSTGALTIEKNNGLPREVEFIPYLGNYGFVPQTLQSVAGGGDGDPLDVIVLSPSVERGTILQVRIIGTICMLDDGEIDDKYVAVLPGTGAFGEITDIYAMFVEFPGAIEIVRQWFELYKPGKMNFVGYRGADDAIVEIERAHAVWSRSKLPFAH
jgi:inorganic pyrophosphatase